MGSACLMAEGGVGPQLISHTFGLLKARDTEGQTAEDKWLSSDEGTEWTLKTVGAIMNALSEADSQTNSKL